MTTTITKMPWDPTTEKKFLKMINGIPMFHRAIAKQVVEKKAQLNAQARRATQIEEQDVVDAFFSEVPKAFYSLMVRILDEAGLDYGKQILTQTKK